MITSPSSISTNLGSNGRPVEIQLCVGIFVLWIDEQCLRVEVVGLLPLGRFEHGISLLFLHLELFGFLQRKNGDVGWNRAKTFWMNITIGKRTTTTHISGIEWKERGEAKRNGDIVSNWGGKVRLAADWNRWWWRLIESNRAGASNIRKDMMKEVFKSNLTMHGSSCNQNWRKDPLQQELGD